MNSAGELVIASVVVGGNVSWFKKLAEVEDEVIGRGLFQSWLIMIFYRSAL